MTTTDSQDELNEENVQTYPADLSYQKLKNKADNYSPLYRLWVDVLYLSNFVRFWFGIIIYPTLMISLFITPFWFLSLFYALWMYYDRETPYNGGRKIKNWKKSTLSKYMRDYFPAGLVKTADLPPNKNYLFAAFPHGLLCSHASVNFLNDVDKFEEFYPNIDLYSATLNSNFLAPIGRDLMLATGMVSVSENSLTTVLTRKPNSGTGMLIVVGGAAECFHMDPEENILVLKKRKGFVRVALKTGSSLVPVFGFGENQLYRIMKNEWLIKMQTFGYKLFGFAPVIPLGRNIGPFATGFPKTLPLITVVGRPIDLPKIENPTNEQIDFYHGKFKDELYELFEKYKDKYDPMGKNAKLTYV